MSEESTTPYKADSPTLTPKRRFQEFRNAPRWKTTTLGEVTFKTDKRNTEGKSYPVYSINNKVGFIPQAEQFEGVDSEQRGYDLTLYKLIMRNTFAYNPARINVGSIGYSGDLHEIIISSLYVCFQTKEDVIDRFLQYFFDTSFFEQSVNNKVEGGIRSYLFYENFSEIHISLPKVEEQKKIADCLSSIDELIATEARKLELLKDHKKGLMQRLFPVDGETKPRLRFAEFRDAGNWKIENLGQLVSYENGKAYEQDISESGKYVVVNSRFISTSGAVRKYSNSTYCLARAGDVLMVLSDLPKGKALAKCFYVEVDDRYAVNQRVCILRASDTYQKFLFHIVNRNRRLLAFDDGINQTHLSKGSVLECQLCIPVQIEEQRKIGDSLTAIDELVACQTLKLEALKTHRNGLMQQLFPFYEEVEA